MLKVLLSKINKKFYNYDERSNNLRKNIVFSLFFKGGNILIGLVLIPLTLSYITPTQYGIWITLSSIINWFSFFDIGFGNGLRNRIAEETAVGNISNARTYISTTYAIISLISFGLFLSFFLINHFVSWNNVLNINSQIIPNLNELALLVFGFFCLQFITQLINTVFFALQSSAYISLLYFIGQFISLFLIFILTKTTKSNFEYLVLVFAGIPGIVQLIGSLLFYKIKFHDFAPHISFINLKFVKNLFSVGGVFFIIQIGALMLYETDNIVIIQVIGPSQVTIFNIAYKLFSVVILISSIILTPFWSAFTDAYAKNDFDWIKLTLKKMYQYFWGVCVFSIILLFSSPLIFKIWLGSKIKVPFLLSFVMILQVISYCWLMINCYLLNGIGKIKLQFYLYLISMVLNIPLSIFLCKKIGVVGVTISNLVVYIYMNIILYVQCKKIINKTANGIWFE